MIFGRFLWLGVCVVATSICAQQIHKDDLGSSVLDNALDGKKKPAEGTGSGKSFSRDSDFVSFDAFEEKAKEDLGYQVLQQSVAKARGEFEKTMKTKFPASYKRLVKARNSEGTLNATDRNAVVKALFTLDFHLQDIIALTWTAFGETRGTGSKLDCSVLNKEETIAEMLSVMRVMANRREIAQRRSAKRNGVKYYSMLHVATLPMQFSSWNPRDSNLPKMALLPIKRKNSFQSKCEKISHERTILAYQLWFKEQVKYQGGLEDPKTTHYHAVNIDPPNWATHKGKLKKPQVLLVRNLKDIKEHYFYRSGYFPSRLPKWMISKGEKP